MKVCHAGFKDVENSQVHCSDLSSTLDDQQSSINHPNQYWTAGHLAKVLGKSLQRTGPLGHHFFAHDIALVILVMLNRSRAAILGRPLKLVSQWAFVSLSSKLCYRSSTSVYIS